MIWFEEELQSKDQPDDIKMILRGIYTPPGGAVPMIIIMLSIDNHLGDISIAKTLFTNTPSALRYEEPIAEDVLAKYQHKILKFKEKIQNAVYAAITQW